VAQKLSGKHPAIVETLGYTVFDDPHSGRELFGLVMEFIDGPTLAQFLAQRQAKNRPLDSEEILHILKPVCEGLEYAHSQGVFHRDVKPQNVLLTRKSQVKLADFGIARVLEDARATVTGQADMGTLGYMPPDRDFDARSDVYLLGNLLLELLTFDPRGDVEARAGCPPAWAELVADSMNRLKGKRPQNVREFLGRLEGRADVPPPPPPKQVETPAALSPLDRIRELIDAERYEDALTEYRRLPHERRRPALLKELQDKWRDRAHALARDAAETDHDFAAAVALVEKLPDALRDTAVLDDYRARRDRLAQLRAGIDADAENHRYSFGLRARVAEYRRLKPDDPAINELHRMLGDVPKEIGVKSLGMKLVFVPRGTFWMGDRDSQRQVEIAHDFYMGVVPVTQQQWQDIMGSNPSHFSRNGGGAGAVKGIPDAELKQFPVEQVSWQDVQEFLQRLNAREKGSEFLYRLPTEAEWEYSCRGGVTSQKDCAFDFYFAQPTNDLTSGQANFGNSLGRTTKVGSYKPNRLGIYDMHGNVWEWCEDVAQGSARVFRGGGWGSDAGNCRASRRKSRGPSHRDNDLGYRLAAVPSGE
jgi:formylglycine-generating enzyme required for sulfatase activity